MGMDVYGKDPASKRGEYFRNNVWWWRPLWEYCQAVTADAAEVKHGQTNDGDGLDAKASRQLAAELERMIESGQTQAYADARTARLKALPDVMCDLCKGTGTRNDQHFQGPCNGCVTSEDKGAKPGWKRPWDCAYPFSVENVKEFAEFLKDCGGFKIC